MEFRDIVSFKGAVALVVAGVWVAQSVAAPGDDDYVADISMFLRIAVTGRENAPDLYTVMQILGEDETRSRIRALISDL